MSFYRNTSNDLLQHRREVLSAAKGILATAKQEGRDLTDAEAAKVEGLTAEARRLKTEWEESPQPRISSPATPMHRGNGSRTYEGLFGSAPSSGQFRGLGDFLAAVGNAPQHHDPRLQPASSMFAGMMESTDSAGGFAVPVEYARDLLAAILERSFMLAHCDLRPMRTSTLKVGCCKVGIDLSFGDGENIGKVFRYRGVFRHGGAGWRK